MSSNSRVEDEIIVLQSFEKKSEDDTETCDSEVNDMVPRLQTLNIIDNRSMYLPYDMVNPASVYTETVSNSMNNLKGDSMADSKEKVCMFFDARVKEDNQVAGNKKSLSETIETPEKVSTNIPVDTQSQIVFLNTSIDREIRVHLVDQKKRQKLNEIGEVNVLNENPLDLSLKHLVDHNYAAKSSSEMSENKFKIYSLRDVSEKMNRRDPETDENLNIILPENPGGVRIDNDLKQCAGDTAGKDIFDLDSSIMADSTDVSLNDQTYDNGIIADNSLCSPDTGVKITASVKGKPFRKIAVFTPPVLGMSEIRQRRFGVFQPEYMHFDATEASKPNSTSDEDSKKSCATKKASPTNSKRKCRRFNISSTILRTLHPLDIKSGEENRPGTCKRKKTSSENWAKTDEKFHKRAKSDNAKTGEKNRLATRSKSVSPGSKTGPSAPSVHLSTEISTISQSRKRTCSESMNVGRVKYRKSSTSSEEA